MFVIEEWEKENSIVFKGYIKYNEIYDEDCSFIKKEKEKQNALYHLYFYIFNSAIFLCLFFLFF